ncbi:MAG TPA: lysine-sensitive aspartokinase 3 [Thermoanaerobaculia bacterium]|nr:lysine-sensitive aspartokinase 3 [Thermoanaerobaculia bacterium]
MIVIKFGGTSVMDADRVRRAIEIVAARQEQRPVVVVSALAGVTNELVDATRLAAAGSFDQAQALVETIRARHEAIGRQLIGQKADFLESFEAQLGRHTSQIADILRGISLVGDVSLRAKDKIVAIGEKLSSVLFSYTMRTQTLVSVHVDSENVIVTDERFGEATPDMDATRAAARKILLPELEREHIPVMGGFFGRSRNGGTTTLGRGGSDFSAAIIGAAIEADEIQIWTDVDGMMTSDPRLIKSARVIDLISYVEAAELAYFGAKVLHPKTIAPAVEKRIPIRVLNSHNPEAKGTLITMEGTTGSGPRALALKRGIAVVHVTSSQMLGAHGFLARIFGVFSSHEFSVDLVTTSEVSVSLTIDREEGLDPVLEEIGKFATVHLERDRAIIALVGSDVIRDRSIGARTIEALDGIPISMLSIGSSGLNFSIVVPEDAAERALREIHRRVFETGSEAA